MAQKLCLPGAPEGVSRCKTALRDARWALKYETYSLFIDKLYPMTYRLLSMRG